ncbi:hypothetical protein [Herbaspirillum huttiense]|uniref:hypothetical protein n=1 Tax=Herbaspirillum huttiense TaxID=863372 RepID=UPI002176D992|nr:hypothetical protein [Herbaspirillum huttiense]UWE17094.1 hypothetical protein NY669_02655 [Herbaspirillum huttiense]
MNEMKEMAAFRPESPAIRPSEHNKPLQHEANGLFSVPARGKPCKSGSEGPSGMAGVAIKRPFDHTRQQKVHSVRCNKIGFYLSRVTKLTFCCQESALTWLFIPSIG